MKLLIRQRLFAWVDSYDVYGESGEARYEVKAATFSVGHKFYVYNKMTGQEVGVIKQKIWSLLPKYEIFMDDTSVGIISKVFSWFKPKYRVDFRGWDVEGDFMGWNYTAKKGEYEVLHVSKELFNLTDTYTLEFQNPADEIPALLLVLAIDAASEDGNGVRVSVKIH